LSWAFIRCYKTKPAAFWQWISTNKHGRKTPKPLWKPAGWKGFPPPWNKPRILCCYEYFPEYIALPVGCLDGLKEILSHYHIKSEIKDKQNHGIPAAFEFHGELREDQREAVKKILPHATGIFSASTAFGKTIVALWIMAQRKINTLILVHRKQLLDQWIERINQFLDIPKSEIGCFSGSKKKRTDIIDIAVMQSIVKKDAVVDWINEYGQIIVDECHHISSSSFERIIRKCPAYYRLAVCCASAQKRIKIHESEFLYRSNCISSP
jgi:hypothetical protein